ncbi:hypothetical protein J3459_013052 [Metarhizium acridum]|nr:hypothetical protein J3459_013052 [Metarhizium acridum]
MCGGLGASDYVFEKLQEFLEWLKSRRPCLGEAKLVRYSDPPTAVVRGLLHDQKNAMFGPRVARASYGVVSEQVDSNNRQRGRDSQGQVAWVIKKGDTIQRHDRFRLKIARTFTSGDPEEWTVGIVSSSRSLKYLPENMQQCKPTIPPELTKTLRHADFLDNTSGCGSALSGPYPPHRFTDGGEEQVSTDVHHTNLLAISLRFYNGLYGSS